METSREGQGSTSKVPLIIGVVAALLGMILVLAGRRDTGPKQEMIGVMTAARDLDSGAAIDAEKLDSKIVPKEALPPGTIQFPPPKGRDKRDFDIQKSFLHGRILTREVRRGEILHESDFELTSEQFLGDILKPGERGVAIEVDRASLMGGLLVPNDCVDVVATWVREIGGANPEERATLKTGRSEVVLENVRVIAVGGRLARMAGGDTGSRGSSVLLALPPDQALALSLVQRDARLSLLLRPAGDAESGYSKRDIGGGDVEALLKSVKGGLPR